MKYWNKGTKTVKSNPVAWVVTGGIVFGYESLEAAKKACELDNNAVVFENEDDAVAYAARATTDVSPSSKLVTLLKGLFGGEK